MTWWDYFQNMRRNVIDRYYIVCCSIDVCIMSLPYVQKKKSCVMYVPFLLNNFIVQYNFSLLVLLVECKWISENRDWSLCVCRNINIFMCVYLRYHFIVKCVFVILYLFINVIIYSRCIRSQFFFGQVFKENLLILICIWYKINRLF